MLHTKPRTELEKPLVTPNTAIPAEMLNKKGNYLLSRVKRISRLLAPERLEYYSMFEYERITALGSEL
jgi:hypothetical protein